MRFLKILFAFLLLPFFAGAQVVIGTATDMAASNNPKIIIAAGGDLINKSSFDFSGVNLNVGITGAASAVSGNWTFKRFRMNTDGNVNLNGNMTITEALIFSSGLLHVQTGKILFTGPSDGISVDGSGVSFVEGPFFQSGKGDRSFPIGTSTSFAPVRFFDVKTSDEIGVQVFDGDPQLQPDNDKVVEILSGRYWEITATDATAINSKVNIGTLGVAPPKDGSPVVVQADQFSTIAENLGNSANNEDNISSNEPVTKKIIAIGKQSEFIVKIHDLISPFVKDGINDGLYIESIESFEFRKVTLLDRWGVLVKEWGSDFTNTNNSFDFAKLSPGNYICIIEYGNAGAKTSKQSQMVTVLKTN